MNQKLSDWANIAEIVSGIALFVTLINLILGVRENTESVRASAFANNVNSLNEFQTEVLTDPEALRVWDAFVSRSTAGLEDLDEQRLTLIVLTFFRICENAYYFDRYGFLGKEEWERFDRNLCVFFERTQLAGRESVLQSILTNEFFEYITGKCSS